MGESREKRLVIIFGAGASISSGLPTTDQLTTVAESAFREAHASHYSGFGAHPEKAEAGSEFANQVLACLRDGFGDSYNYEVLIHAVRSLYAFTATTQGAISGAPASYRPVASLFAAIVERFEVGLRATILHQAFFDTIRSIHRFVGSAMEQPSEPLQTESREKTIQFIKTCASRYRITTVSLNYDTLVDDAAIEWFDGFPPIAERPGYSSFDPSAWIAADDNCNILLHMHGSVKFGYPPTPVSPNLSSPWEPVKYDRMDAYKSMRQTGSGLTLIAGMDYGAFALISGMEKAASLAYNMRPFGYYYLKAAEAILKSNRLVVVGYGGRDPHVNALIAEHSEIHGDNRRAVAIMPYDVGWQSEHTRGENRLLRLLVGRDRWDSGHGLACGLWRGTEVDAGPLRLLTRGVPDSYENSAAICDYLNDF